ncbi:hypothetical protein N0V82_003846 [Gnomoniopsis sp. IMI 355080]|nr:hypothetical protein N0V82_003846 [Gnomoniopsis sp. IMI 355080]
MSQHRTDVENVDPTLEQADFIETTDNQKRSISNLQNPMAICSPTAKSLHHTANNIQTHTQMPQPSFALAADVVRNDSMSTRPPSPPYLHVPTLDCDPNDPAKTILPLPSGPGYLTPDTVATITGNRPQALLSKRVKDAWQYEHRRRAQPILDFLYLGPLAVARDHSWLKKEGITMIYAVREGIMVGRRLMSVEKTAAELGLEVDYLDMDDRQVLIRSFPAAIELINAHMIRVKGAGKVLVMCETGNERSATLVAAYIMAMYGQQMVNAVQYVGQQRFCTHLTEGDKQLLLSYEHLLKATRMTTEARLEENVAEKSPPFSRKRGIEDIMDEDVDGDVCMDGSRFSDRAAFVPYMEK